MMRAVYTPGDSVIHQTPAGVKLAILAGVAVIVSAASGQVVCAAGVMVAVAWLSAGLGGRTIIGVLRPLAVILVFIFVAQWLLRDAATAGLVAARLTVLVVAAALVSATTKVSDMLATLERVLAPLRPLGVNAETVSFMIVLAIRFVPSLFRIAGEVRDAQRARGLERQPVAMVVPLLLRTLREADDVAEALAARGWTPR